MLVWLKSVGQNRTVGAAAAGGVVGIILLMLFLLLRGQRDTVVLQVQPITDSSIVRVYVGGEVTAPGLYSLQRGSRVADAIDAAGGLLSSADIAGLGMAAILEDADQIVVPQRRSLPTAASQPVATPAVGLAGPAATTVPPQATAVVEPTPADGLININSATLEELDRLPGIGPVLAGRIVDYRLQNGPFQTLEELEAVQGISMRMVDELRPLITLGH